MVNHHKYGIRAIRGRKRLNEVHGNRFPRMQRNWELLEYSVRLVKLGLGMHASCTGLAVILDVTLETWPVEIMSDKTNGLILF